MRALLRRSGAEGDPDQLTFEELSLDSGRHGVVVGENFVELTRTEYQLLELLMLNPRRVLPHATIYDRVWGYDFGPSSNALRVYVGYLRRKLEEGGARAADPHRARRRLLPARAMTLRARIAAVAGVAVAVAILATAVFTYLAVRSSLRGEIDALARASGRSRSRGRRRRSRPGRARRSPGAVPAAAAGAARPRPRRLRSAAPQGVAQFVTASGAGAAPARATTRSCPWTTRTEEIAAAGEGRQLMDTRGRRHAHARAHPGDARRRARCRSPARWTRWTTSWTTC